MSVWLLPALFFALPAVPAAASPPPQVARRSVRVLVQNIYGRREKNCEERYKALAKQILSASPPYDVVALNEHWKVRGDRWFSCDADVLTKALEAGGLKGIKHLPQTDDALQVAGGNSVFSPHPIVDAYENRFVNSRDLPLSGFVLARVELTPGVVLDLWDAHLEAGSDGCDDDCRWEQAADFGSSVELFSGLPEKGKTGNPVLIVGDFNTGGPLAKSDKPPFPGNGGYENIIEALGDPRDLWLEFGSGDGYTYDCQTNQTQNCKGRERIDYVFLPEDPKVLHPSSPFVLLPRAISVVRWKTSSGQPVSDHYGLDVTLELLQRPAPPSDVSEALGAAAERIRRLTPRW